MRFSVHIPTAAAGLAHPVPFASLDDILRIADAAESLGYDGVWGNYHVTTQAYVRERWPEPPDYFDTLIVLAAIATRTTRLELGTALLLPTMYLLPVLAKQVATLDVLSGGRFRFGVGVGAYREEFDAVWPDRSAANRGRWLDEALDGLRALFTERRTSFTGEYVRFEGVDSFPRPLQDPLPIYVGGHNLRAIERAANVGHGWLPGWQPHAELRRRIEYLRAQLQAAGRPTDAVEVAPQLSVTIAATDAEAERRYSESGLVQHRQSLAYTGRDPRDQVQAHLLGSPSTIRDRVADLQSIGVDHCCALWFSTTTVEEMLDQMEWFARDVIKGRGG